MPENQIETVIEVARRVRDETVSKLDSAFDEKQNDIDGSQEDIVPKETNEEACFTSTPSG